MGFSIVFSPHNQALFFLHTVNPANKRYFTSLETKKSLLPCLYQSAVLIADRNMNTAPERSAPTPQTPDLSIKHLHI